MPSLADLLTIDQCLGLEGTERVAFVGDANNVWRSLRSVRAAGNPELASGT